MTKELIGDGVVYLKRKIARMSDGLPAGFTLLEVMIAVAIAAFVLVGLLSSQSQSVSIAAATRFDSDAAWLAREKISDIKLLPFDDVYDDSGDFGADYPSFTWEVKVSDLEPDSMGLDAEAVDVLKKVTVVVRSDNNELVCHSVVISDVLQF